MHIITHECSCMLISSHQHSWAWCHEHSLEKCTFWFVYIFCIFRLSLIKNTKPKWPKLVITRVLALGSLFIIPSKWSSRRWPSTRVPPSDSVLTISCWLLGWLRWSFPVLCQDVRWALMEAGTRPSPWQRKERCRCWIFICNIIIAKKVGYDSNQL